MNFIPKNKISNIFLLVGSFAVVSLILWNTNSFFKQFKEEERLKMEIWATAQSEFLQSSETVDLGSLHLKVFQNNTSTPMILINKDESIRVNNFRGRVGIEPTSGLNPFLEIALNVFSMHKSDFFVLHSFFHYLCILIHCKV